MLPLLIVIIPLIVLILQILFTVWVLGFVSNFIVSNMYIVVGVGLLVIAYFIPKINLYKKRNWDVTLNSFISLFGIGLIAFNLIGFPITKFLGLNSMLSTGSFFGGTTAGNNVVLTSNELLFAVIVMLIAFYVLRETRIVRK